MGVVEEGERESMTGRVGRLNVGVQTEVQTGVQKVWTGVLIETLGALVKAIVDC